MNGILEFYTQTTITNTNDSVTNSSLSTCAKLHKPYT